MDEIREKEWQLDTLREYMEAEAERHQEEADLQAERVRAAQQESDRFMQCIIMNEGM
jgi:hypothetical protein